MKIVSDVGTVLISILPSIYVCMWYILQKFFNLPLKLPARMPYEPSTGHHLPGWDSHNE